MGDHTFWINWFRSVTPKTAAAPRHAPSGAPAIDPKRLSRVMKGTKVNSAAQDLGWLKPLSPAKRMIHWLKTQPAEVVDAAAQNLNLSQAEEVLLWLLARPATDAATAVKLFMRAEPACYVDRKADDPSCEYTEFDEKVVLTFAANWTANRYARGGVGYDPTEVCPYGSSDIFFINELNEDIAKHRANGIHPIPPLPGLAGPFNGPAPKELNVYLGALSRDELFLVRFLFAGLGTWIIDDAISEADFDGWIRKNGLSAE